MPQSWFTESRLPLLMILLQKWQSNLKWCESRSIWWAPILQLLQGGAEIWVQLCSYRVLTYHESVQSICSWQCWPQLDNTRLCFYQTRSAWSRDQGSNKNHSPAHNFAPTVTKFCVMWEGLSLPHDTKFGNCRCKIVDSRVFPIWSLIHGSSWSGLIKAEPDCLHNPWNGCYCICKSTSRRILCRVVKMDELQWVGHNHICNCVTFSVGLDSQIHQILNAQCYADTRATIDLRWKMY